MVNNFVHLTVLISLSICNFSCSLHLYGYICKKKKTVCNFITRALVYANKLILERKNKKTGSTSFTCAIYNILL